ncbi:MAG TPA: hypothetical protein VF037_00610 [Gemmatimonadales bacterium]
MTVQNPPVEVFQTGPPVSESVLIAMTVIALLIGTIYILGPIARAIARRIESKGIDAGTRDDLQVLRERMAEMDGLRERVIELEERIDFAERLLAQPERERLGPG